MLGISCLLLLCVRAFGACVLRRRESAQREPPIRFGVLELEAVWQAAAEDHLGAA